MYFTVLFIHSWLRWVVVVSLLVVLFRSLLGYFKKSAYTKLDNMSSLILVASTHIQVLLGIFLYFFLSPLTTSPMAENFMKNPVLRYWKVEHFFMMILFLILVQTGRSLSKKSASDIRKHKIMAIFSTLAAIILTLGMPWPEKPYGRPLFREANFLDKKIDS